MTETETGSGADPLSWVRKFTPILTDLGEQYRKSTPLEGRFVAVSAPMTPHTGLFIETLAAAGAEVGFTGEPGSTHPEVVAHLDSLPGVTAYSEAGQSVPALEDAQRALLREEPDLIADDGAYLLSLVHDEFPDIADGVVGGCEQTTGGMTRLAAMEEEDVVAFPVYGVNDTPMKDTFDNVHGTAESSISNLVSITNTMIGGKTAVVAGYGRCGRGIASKLRALGANTIVTEVDPRRALAAIADGHEVTELADAVEDADYVITATGRYGVVRREHLERMADDAILASIGSFIEIDVDALADLATDVTSPTPGIDRYHLADGRTINLATEGKVVNLSGPDSAGNPSEVMDTTFAMMATALVDLADRGADMRPGLHSVPDRLDRRVANRKLESLGVSIDRVSDAQRSYHREWATHSSVDSPEE